jgi:hypothetical protein
MIPPQDGASTRSFLTTPWSLLFALSEDREPTDSDREYMQLLSIYWRLIRSFIAAHGCGSSEASEMAKRFIVSLVDRNHDCGTRPWRNSLRAYVFHELKEFIRDERRAERAREGHRDQR